VVIDPQKIGGVQITVISQPITVGGTYYLGGPTPTVVLPIQAPIDACAFVVCVQAGDPIIIPSQQLPVIPVYIPPQTVGPLVVNIPVIGYTPPVTVPGVTTPPVNADIVQVSVYAPSDVNDQVSYVFNELSYLTPYVLKPSLLFEDLAYEVCSDAGGTYDGYGQCTGVSPAVKTAVLDLHTLSTTLRAKGH
jgi:hypothetical protein